MKNPICFYHRADLDGKCSGALVRENIPDCEMYGIDYGDEFPWEKARRRKVYMVDFALQPFSRMYNLNAEADLVWIDHHKTAIDAYDMACGEGKPLIEGIREVGMAACELTWEYFCKTAERGTPGYNMPKAIRYLGRYDVWDHKEDHDILAFQSGMRTIPNSPTEEVWRRLFAGDPILFGNIKQRGEVAMDIRDIHQRGNVDIAFETRIGDLLAICINKMSPGSFAFKYCYDPARHDLMVGFGRRANPNAWTVSMYSDKEWVKVNRIAKLFGGGGHDGAAGFQCEELPFEI